MVKKHGFGYFVKYYNLLFYLAFAVVLYLLKDYIFLLFCQLTQVTSERSIFYKINQLLVPIGLIALWAFIFFYNTREKAYRYRTGRSFGYDSGHYHRTYNELVDYFKDADPMAMDVESLPTMKWQDSSGLIFGKKNGKLISFEPQKNGICAMV